MKKLLLFAAIIILSLFSSEMFSQESLTTGKPFDGDIYHTGGNFGIGTVNPNYLLHLYAGNNTGIRLEKFFDETPKGPGPWLNFFLRC